MWNLLVPVIKCPLPLSFYCVSTTINFTQLAKGCEIKAGNMGKIKK